jgi:branched-chain amino acid transport system permease protein
MEYYINLLIFVGIYAILAQSYNLIFGLGRLLNLAHAASYAIGAYAAALLSTEYGWSFFPCLLGSVVISALFASLIGAISIRLTSDYFAVGSLAFASIVSALLINWKSLTRGVLGIAGIPRPTFFGLDFLANQMFLGLTVCLALVVQFFLFLAFRNAFSRQLRAQGEHDQAALSLGINSGRTRLLAFFIGSAFAGLAGCLFAYYINYIDPSSFSMNEMVFVLTIVVVGSPGSFWGVLLASAFLVLLPEPLRFINFSPGILGPARQMLYAVILFLVVAWKRETIFPVERKV